MRFAGHIINGQGSKLDPDKVKAIQDFLVPETITDLQSFIGLAKKFTDYTPDLRHNIKPMKPLLQKKKVYKWAPEHTAAMNKVKKIITGPNCLQQFDMSNPSVLITDASIKGLRYILIQTDKKIEIADDAEAINKPVAKHKVKKMLIGKLICCRGRFLSQAEQNYAVVDKELLAVQWAVQKSRVCLAEANFTVITDHQPLLGILNGKNIDAIHNVRIQRIMSKLIGYQFRLLWTQGKVNRIADALSRNPVFNPEPEEEQDILACLVVVARKVGEASEDAAKTDLAIEALTEHAENDKEYNRLYLGVKE